MKHFLRKLGSTMSILFNLGMARTFGEYVHTAHGLAGEFDYARYRWRGQEWAIPTTAFFPKEDRQ